MRNNYNSINMLEEPECEGKRPEYGKLYDSNFHDEKLFADIP